MNATVLSFLKENRSFFLPYLLFLLLGSVALWIYPTGYWVQWLVEKRNTYANYFFQYATMLGEAIPFAIALVWFATKNEIKKAITLAIAAPISVAINTLLKQLFYHPRPVLYFYTQLQTQLPPVPEVPLHSGYTSFPSGHTMAAFALFALLSFFSSKKKIGFLFFIAALTTAISRIYLGQHFLKDVYAGSIVGCLLACAAYFAFKKFSKPPPYAPLLAFILIPMKSPAQATGEQPIDTSIQLPMVMLTQPTFSASLMSGEHQQRQHITPDTLDMLLNGSQNIGELFSKHAAAKLRLYAPGMLSTLSLRGSGAQHLLTVWNGLPLKNPMNGTNDLSLFPTPLLGQAKLILGSGTADDGPGAIGGVLLLNDKINVQKEPQSNIHTQMQVGSFGLLSQNVSIEQNGKHSGGSLRWYLAKAQNNYQWKINNQIGQQQNNKYLIQGFSGFYKHYFKKIGRISAHTWIQTAFRQIPPSRTETNIHAIQNDRHIRWVVDWQKNNNQKWSYGFKIGKNREYLDYHSDLLPPSPDTMSFQMTEARIAKNRQGNSIFFAFRQTREQAWSDNIETTGQAVRNTQSLQIAGQYQINNSLKTGFSSNWQLTDKKINPPNISTYITAKTEKHLFRIRTTQNFNLPTFNDLYWQGNYASGNPQLKPELARALECSYQLKTKHLLLWQTGSITQTQNLILWQNGPSAWQPNNVRKVVSPGINTGIKIKTKTIQIRMESDFQDPRVRQSAQPQDPALGQRLIYYPAWSHTALIAWKHNNTQLALFYSYTGKRFTTTDNNKWLAPFHQLDISVKQHIKFKSKTLEIRILITNLSGKNHEYLPYRPLPGRQWQINFTLI